MLPFSFSRFLESIEVDGKLAIFHRLHPSPIFLEKEQWCHYRKKPYENEDFLKFLEEEGLLINAPEEDEAELRRIRAQYEVERKQVTILYLILTSQCNLACRYCFVSRENRKRSRKDIERKMSIKTALRGIDLWARHVRKNFAEGEKPCITIYGGEPLLNMPTFRASVEYVRKLQEKGDLPENLDIVVVTNGTLITSEIADFFAKEKVKVSLSIDGPAEVHNPCRIFRDRSPSFEKVMRGLKILQQKKVDVTASVTITPYNIGFIEEMPTWLSNLGIKGFGLNELIGKTLSMLNSGLEFQSYSRIAAEAIIGCFRRSREIGVYEDRMARKVRAFTESDFYAVDCGAYGGQIVIQPDGSVSNCHASKKYNITSLEKCGGDFWIWDSPQVKNWQNRLPLYKEECLDCPALSICGGGCAYTAEETNNDLMAKDDQFCYHTKRAFDFLLSDLLEKTDKKGGA